MEKRMETTIEICSCFSAKGRLHHTSLRTDAAVRSKQETLGSRSEK